MGVVMPCPRGRERPGAAWGRRWHLPGPVATGVAPLPAMRHLRAPIVSTRISTGSVGGQRHPEAVSDIALPCDSNVRGAAVHGRSGN